MYTPYIYTLSRRFVLHSITDKTLTWVTWRMSHKTQNILALCELLGLPRSFLRSVLLIFLYFCVVFFVLLCFSSLGVLCPNAARVSEYPFMTAHSIFSSWNIHPCSTGAQNLFVLLGLNCKYCSLDALPIFRLWAYLMKS